MRTYAQRVRPERIGHVDNRAIKRVCWKFMKCETYEKYSGSHDGPEIAIRHTDVSPSSSESSIVLGKRSASDNSSFSVRSRVKQVVCCSSSKKPLGQSMYIYPENRYNVQTG